MIGRFPEVAMRSLCLVAALIVFTSGACAAEQNWIVICLGEDAQYTQTIGGSGYFHVGIGNHTYDTQKLTQSFYDGNTVCAIPDPKAPRANSDIAEICASRTSNMISVLYRSDTQTKMAIPKNAQPYCKARIDVL
jgi:opacity protein-like surface antigen